MTYKGRVLNMSYQFDFWYELQEWDAKELKWKSFGERYYTEEEAMSVAETLDSVYKNRETSYRIVKIRCNTLYMKGCGDDKWSNRYSESLFNAFHDDKENDIIPIT